MNVDASKGGQKYLPIYEHPYWWAKRFGELDQFHASHTLNVACATAIDLTLAKHYDFDTGHPDIAPAAKEIVDKFGFDRTMYVLASTVWDYAWDDNISPSSKEWARTIPCYDEPDVSRGYSVSGNTDVIDRLIAQVRHDYSLAQSAKYPAKEGTAMSKEGLSMDDCELLFARVDASMEERRAEWMNLTPDALIEQAKEIAAFQDVHAYLAQGRGIDPEGVDYLLTLADPLQAVADHWLKRMDDLSDFGFALDDLCRCRNAPSQKSVLAQLHAKLAAEPSKPHSPMKKEEER